MILRFVRIESSQKELNFGDIRWKFVFLFLIAIVKYIFATISERRYQSESRTHKSDAT